MPKIDLRNALRIKTAAGEVSRLKWQGGVWPSGGAAVPSLSVPFVLFVARDADLTNRKWQSRFGGGLPAGLEMDAHGSPAIVTDQTWAPGVPVMSMAGGCWLADRDVPFPEAFGFSFSVISSGTATGMNQFYNGPPILSSSDQSGISFRVETATAITASVGNSAASGGRINRWSGSFPGGRVTQWDRPPGEMVPLGSMIGYSNGTVATNLWNGTEPTRSNGTRFIVGGDTPGNGSGSIRTATMVRLLAVLLTVGGTPMTAADRATWQAFAEGLKTGAVT